MTLRSVRIGARLGIGFALVLALLAAMVVGGNSMRERSMRDLARGLEAATTKVVLAEQMKSDLMQAAIAMRNIGLQSEVAGTNAEEDKVRQQRKLYAQARDQLKAAGLGQAEQQVVDEIGRLDQQTEKPLLEAVGESLLFNNEVAAKVITTQIDPINRKTIEAINRLVDMQQAELHATLDRARGSARELELLMYALGAFAIAIGLVSSALITRSITRPLQGAVAAARSVADGDLSVAIDARGTDETGQLLHALADMTGKLRMLVGDVAAGARTVADSSAQVAQGNMELSQRTEEQASTLEETASSMEELTSTVTQNAENARQASALAVTASEVARRGGDVVGEVVSTMSGISESSRRIAEIIGVIDGIAFQTNILALNAAVEAARAGEQGRGFAVVASEVRGLAQRSAEAAKEIKGLIGDSVGKVDAGTRLVDAAGRTMQDIVESVKKVSDLIADIAAASQEQSSGIEQVNTAISQMDRVVQQNASLVEEASASTETMKAQAGALLQNVARFRLSAQEREHAQDAPSTGQPLATAPAPQPIRVLPARRSIAAAATTPQPRVLPAGAGDKGPWREF